MKRVNSGRTCMMGAALLLLLAWLDALEVSLPEVTFDNPFIIMSVALLLGAAMLLISFGRKSLDTEGDK